MASEAELLEHAKAMRRNPTEPEKRLWRALSNSQLSGFKFRRQHVLYEAQAVLDFFCPAIGLAIEIDGDTHDAQTDAARDERIGRMDFTTLRFSNTDVMFNPEGVAQRVLEIASGLPNRWSGSRSAPPQPLP